MFESRTSELTEDEFRRILHDKCKDYVSRPKLLQRSKERPSSKFTFIDPKQHERTPLKSGTLAAGVDTKHHILLMDNLPSWVEFPKRSQSIIGITMEDPRQLFGCERFLIIPFDGAKFGMAPSSDLWGCEVKLASSKYKHFGFDNKLSVMFRVNNISDTSYPEMISDLQKLYESEIPQRKSEPFIKGIESSKVWDDLIAEPKTMLDALFFQARKDGFDKIEDALDIFFAPSKFKGTSIDSMSGFNIMSYQSLKKLDSYDCYEFWTDSECLLFYLGRLTHGGSEIEEAYQQFVNDFIK